MRMSKTVIQRNDISTVSLRSKSQPNKIVSIFCDTHIFIHRQIVLVFWIRIEKIVTSVIYCIEYFKMILNILLIT